MEKICAQYKMMSLSTSSLHSNASTAPSLCSVSTTSTRSSTTSAASALTENTFDIAARLPPSFSDTYELIKRLDSKGAFSSVCLARHLGTLDLVAVKIISRSGLKPSDDAAVFEEVAVLRKLNREAQRRHRLNLVHDLKQISGHGVIRLLDFFSTPSTFYIVTELMDGGDLFDQIVKRGRYIEEEGRSIIYSILQTLQFIHENKIAHRDLKPENLLISSVKQDDSRRDPIREEEDNDGSYQIKIADFGLATKVKTPQSLKERCGTPMYVAPEVLRGIPYDQSADMWSLGVITYFLISGCPPFMDNKKKGLFLKIINGTYCIDGGGWDCVSDEAKSFITSCLTVDPAGRISAEDALKHEWFRC